MAIEKIVSTKNGNKVVISVSAAHGVLNGKPYSVYGPAYLKVDSVLENGFGIRLWLETEELLRGISSDEAAMAMSQMLFANKIAQAENLDVIKMVREYGNGEYVADLRGTSWQVGD